MKKLLYIILPLIALAFSSCEEEESPLIFSTENITNPENIKIEYYSPDPSCVPKEYVITANNCESEITLKCKNANKIFLGNFGASTDSYDCLTDKWNVRVVDSNTLIFTFDKISLEDTDEDPYIMNGINILAENKKRQVSTFIKVFRCVDSPDPVN